MILRVKWAHIFKTNLINFASNLFDRVNTEFDATIFDTENV